MVKHFRTAAGMQAWINRNKHRYQIDVIIVANGHAVEYRKLRIINIR